MLKNNKTYYNSDIICKVKKSKNYVVSICK